MSIPLSLPAEVHQRLLDAVPHLIDALVSLAQGTATTTHERRVASATLRTRERSYKGDEYERFLFPWREEEEMVLVARDTYKHKPEAKAASLLFDLLQNSVPATQPENCTAQEQMLPQDAPLTDTENSVPTNTSDFAPPEAPFRAPDRTDDDCSPRLYLPPELIKNSSFQHRITNKASHTHDKGAHSVKVPLLNANSLPASKKHPVDTWDSASSVSPAPL